MEQQTPRPGPGITFENLNVKPGEAASCTPESEAALKEFASVKYGASSSIKESGPVTVTSEGGPDSRSRK